MAFDLLTLRYVPHRNDFESLVGGWFLFHERWHGVKKMLGVAGLFDFAIFLLGILFMLS